MGVCVLMDAVPCVRRARLEAWRTRERERLADQVGDAHQQITCSTGQTALPLWPPCPRWSCSIHTHARTVARAHAEPPSHCRAFL